jgi:hypothetical protein
MVLGGGTGTCGSDPADGGAAAVLATGMWLKNMVRVFEL